MMQGRLRSPKNQWLWLASLRMELRAGNEKAAENVLAKSLQVWRVSCVCVCVFVCVCMCV
jgi:hypothetical protein